MPLLTNCPQCQHRLIRRPGAERLSCSLCDWVEVGEVASAPPATPDPLPSPTAAVPGGLPLKPSYILMGVVGLAVLAFLLGRSCQPATPPEDPLLSPSPEITQTFAPEPTPLVTPSPESSPEASESPASDASPSPDPAGTPDPQAAIHAVESAVAALEGGEPAPLVSPSPSPTASPSADNGTMLVQPPDIPPPVATDPPVDTAP